MMMAADRNGITKLDHQLQENQLIGHLINSLVIKLFKWTNFLEDYDRK